MTDEPEAEIIEEQVADEPAQEPAQQPDPEIAESQETARKYGWRPKEEYDLDPEGWVDADRFLELGSTQRKIVQDQNKALERKLDESAKEFQARIERIEKASKVASERALEQQKQQYEERLRQLTERQRQAVEVADTDAWDALEKQKAEVIKNAPTAEPAQTGPDPVVQEYRAKNDWAKDPILWDQAVRIIDAYPEAQAHDAKGQLEYAEKHMRRYYPHLFAETPTAPAAPAAPKRQMVDGGGLAPRPSGKGVNSLPPEALKAGKEFVADNLYKSLEEYAKVYWEQD